MLDLDELNDFIEKPSQNCTDDDLTNGINTVITVLDRNPSDLINTLANHPYIAATYLFSDLVEKMKKKQCLEKLEPLFTNCFDELIDNGVYNQYDLKRLVDAVPHYLEKIMEAILASETRMQRLFENSDNVTQTLEEIGENYPTYAQRFTAYYKMHLDSTATTSEETILNALEDIHSSFYHHNVQASVKALLKILNDNSEAIFAERIAKIPIVRIQKIRKDIQAILNQIESIEAQKEGCKNIRGLGELVVPWGDVTRTRNGDLTARGLVYGLILATITFMISILISILVFHFPPLIGLGFLIGIGVGNIGPRLLQPINDKLVHSYNNWNRKIIDSCNAELQSLEDWGGVDELEHLMIQLPQEKPAVPLLKSYGLFGRDTVEDSYNTSSKMDIHSHYKK